nr:hypothetical protein [Vibrio parahaemolyticus]
MRFPNPKLQIAIEHRHIKLPNGLGLVRYRNSRDVVGELRNATVSLNFVGEWYISIMCLVDVELPTHSEYQHKTTTSISKNHAMVICEALKVANMSKSAKGDSESHGKNIAAKSELNKSILD